MIFLHAGSGSWEIDLQGLHLPAEKWATFREHVRRLLIARKRDRAANLLDKIPFELYNGTNPFGDEFTVLHAKVELEQYTKIAEAAEDPGVKKAAAQLAHTVSEIGPYVRFVVVVLDSEQAVEPVA